MNGLMSNQFDLTNKQDASVPVSAVKADIAALADISAGGLEFLAFQNYGFPPFSTDWSVYGFGTPAFKEVLKGALSAAAENKLVLDIAIGPATGSGVPAIPRTEGLAMELVYGAKTINASDKIGSLPQPVLKFNHGFLNGWVHEPEDWGASELVAVVAAEVKEKRQRSGGGSNSMVVLNGAKVFDITNVTQSWEVPASARTAGKQWVVMAFYQRYSNERTSQTNGRPTSWVGNGSWVVDHFSAAGAKKATDFWDHTMFDDKEIDRLTRQVGMYLWEDSMEMMTPLWWTRDFLSRFETARGYSAAKYLPVFFQAKNLWNGYGEPYDQSYMFDGQPADGGKYAEDYRLTLNEGYQDFLRQYQKWAVARGMEHSAQPAYNMPLDMSSAVPLVGGPELESMGFDESIDSYRQFTGAAHLFNRNSISTEIGAKRGGAYVQSVPSLLSLFRDSFAAGVNTLVIHGMPYEGPYPGTTWPGYTPFDYEFADMWGPRQPAWRHLNDTMLYSARNSEVLKTGVPRIDLAFYAWKHPWSSGAVFKGGDALTAAGYTFEYLGPDNLASTTASVKDGVLAPDGPAYKAIVLYGQTKITPAASAALLHFAAAGMPIFLVGLAPSTTIGSQGQATVTANMAALVNGSFPSVTVLTDTASFGAAKLQEKDILPRVVASPLEVAKDASQLYTQWRSKPGSGLDLVYILNRGAKTTFDISFAVPETAVPYIIDAWTGEQTRMAAYLRTRDGITARISLAHQQSAVLAFRIAAAELPLYIVSRSSNIAGLRVNQDGNIEGLINDGNEANVLLSDNREIDIPAVSNTTLTAPSTTTLGPWTLTFESYAAPAVLSTASVSPNRTVTTISSPLQSLVPWTKIPGIERSSGVGTYRTTFKRPGRVDGNNTAVTIHFTGAVLNTIRVRVNGVLVPAIDITAPDEGRDVTALLKAEGGDNEIVVETSSTLFNAVKARVNDLRTIGNSIHYPEDYSGPTWKEFGLVGEVVVKTWRRVSLS
ncbi:hypothetical protein B0H66DRAFT_630330 [Apodospora peruviana]|uniref:Uncharacterized protein n=1 Tax=Apodospora peruviana TaxID=516989 RepID=A0AAE0HW95_9PEZI|nr:hypothetical protein B0H66DRAFT_630330 [Apodospora peruviana]